MQKRETWVRVYTVSSFFLLRTAEEKRVGLAICITPNRQQSPPSREPFGHSLFDEQSAVGLGSYAGFDPQNRPLGSTVYEQNQRVRSITRK